MEHPTSAGAPEATSLQVVDFGFGHPIGALVRRSPHHQRDACVQGRPQLGIITEIAVYPDARGLPVSWPVVAWEDTRTGPAITHPVRVEFARADQRRATRWIAMCE